MSHALARGALGALARRAPVALGVALALTCAGAAAPAEASVVEGNVVTIGAVALGTAGGMTTSIAAIVYASEGRSFDDGWVTTSLFTSAICGATAVAMALGVTSGDGAYPIIGVLFYGLIAGWPLYWTVRSALAEVDPGQRFDDLELDVTRRDVARDPLASLAPRALTTSTRSAVTVPLLALRF